MKSQGTNKSHGSVNLSASYTVDISVVESGMRRAQKDEQLMKVPLKQQILIRPKTGKTLPEKEFIISNVKVQSPVIFSERI